MRRYKIYYNLARIYLIMFFIFAKNIMQKKLLRKYCLKIKYETCQTKVISAFQRVP